ncbi:MAG: nitronate monooxygenase family protein [candidate division WOR-3 bacterium]|nr:nitronate monooxygenase family protein [candidate division WOR-3 bacterium]
MDSMKCLKIGELVARLPIIQGGMGVNISLAGLASAVANEGGIGVIATAGIGMFEEDLFTNFLEANNRALRKEIRKARALAPGGILGVNIMVALTNYADLARTAIEEKIDIIFSGAGLPLSLPELLKGSRTTKLVPIVSSGRAASLLIKRWLSKSNYAPDAIVVEGPLAGGHLGFHPDQIDDPKYALELLIPEVLAAVRPFEESIGRPIPVIAAGGIFTGHDIDKFLEMGAAGVQMATRFVGTEECDSSPVFKQAYVNSRKEDIVIIHSPVGMPARVVKNDFVERYLKGERVTFGCPYHCLLTCEPAAARYCIAQALVASYRGDMEHGYAMCGANAWRCNKIVSVHELVQELAQETAAALRAQPLSPHH